MIAPEVVAAAQASHKKFYPYGPFVSVTLAQWAVESGWGRHVSGRFNYFGVKASPDQVATRHATQVLTNEYFNGAMHQVEQWFANYDSLEDCFDAHARLLTTDHYSLCRQARDPEEYCNALQKCGYATAPNYASALLAVIKGSDLTQFDGGTDEPG